MSRESCAPLPRRLASGRDFAKRSTRMACGRFPSPEEGLGALIRNPGIAGWRGPYVAALKSDPWNHEYRYGYQRNVAVVSSAGPDGIHGTPDDLREVDLIEAGTNRPPAARGVVSVELDRRERQAASGKREAGGGKDETPL